MTDVTYYDVTWDMFINLYTVYTVYMPYQNLLATWTTWQLTASLEVQNHHQSTSSHPTANAQHIGTTTTATTTTTTTTATTTTTTTTTSLLSAVWTTD